MPLDTPAPRQSPASRDDSRLLTAERLRLLRAIEKRLEMPMVVLGLVWLVLLILELTRGLAPWMEGLVTAIWVIFILDFLIKFTIAPRKIAFLKSNWLTVIALAVPALRIFRFVRALTILRAARATRGVRLVKVVASLNRGMRALGKTMSRRGFGYVVALTVIVTFAGAAGMYAFERDAATANTGIHDYGAALWWTSMLMTTMGSEYWPRTAEGRLLCLILSLYAFAVFGYVTATIASFFIGRDADDEQAELAGAKAIEALRQDVAALRAEIAELRHGRSAP